MTLSFMNCEFNKGKKSSSLSKKGEEGKCKKNAAPGEFSPPARFLSSPCQLKSGVVSCLICRNELVSGRSLLCNWMYIKQKPIPPLFPIISHPERLQICKLCPNVSELNIQPSQPSITASYDFPLHRFDFCNWDKMTGACANLCVVPVHCRLYQRPFPLAACTFLSEGGWCSFPLTGVLGSCLARCSTAGYFVWSESRDMIRLLSKYLIHPDVTNFNLLSVVMNLFHN